MRAFLFSLVILLSFSLYAETEVKSTCSVDARVKAALEKAFKKSCEEIDKIDPLYRRVGYLDLRDQGFTSVNPEDFKGFSITVLDLSFNQIEHVPAEPFWVQAIDLSYNKIQSVPESVVDQQNSLVSLLGNPVDQKTISMIRSKYDGRDPRGAKWFLDYDLDYISINFAGQIFGEASPQNLAAMQNFVSTFAKEVPQARWLPGTQVIFNNLNSISVNNAPKSPDFRSSETEGILEELDKLVACGYEIFVNTKRTYGRQFIAKFKDSTCEDDSSNKLRKKLADLDLSSIMFEASYFTERDESTPLIQIELFLGTTYLLDHKSWKRREKIIATLASDIKEEWPYLSLLLEKYKDPTALTFTFNFKRPSFQLKDIAVTEEGNISFKLHVKAEWGDCMAGCSQRHSRTYEVNLNSQGELTAPLKIISKEGSPWYVDWISDY